MNYLTKTKVSPKEYYKWTIIFVVVGYFTFAYEHVYRFQDLLLGSLFDFLKQGFIKPVNIEIIKQYFFYLFHVLLLVLLVALFLKLKVWYFFSKQHKFRKIHFFLGSVLFCFFYLFYIGIEIFINDSYYTSKFDIKAFLNLCLVALFVIPIKAFFMELFFRAFTAKITTFLTSKKILILVILSLFFLIYECYRIPVAYLNFSVLLYLLYMGVFFSVLYLLTDGIEVGVGAFYMNNFITTIFVSQKWYNLESDAIFFNSSPVQENIFMNYYLPMIIFTIFVILVIKIFKISDWKERLTGVVS